MAWLIAIARSRAIDRLRSRKIRIERENDAGREISIRTSFVDRETGVDNAMQAQERTAVRGALSEQTLRAVVGVQLPIAFFIAVRAHMSMYSLGALLFAFLGLGVYDLWGKRCAWPLVTDAVQGVGWAALVFVGAARVGGRIEERVELPAEVA